MKKNLLILVILCTLFVSSIAIIQAKDNWNENLNSTILNSPKNSNETSPSSCYNLDGLPPVGNQVVAGSCYAWAAAYYYLTYLQWQEYGWDVNDPAHQCSPAFVYNLTNGGVDNGASEGVNARRDAFKVFETLGCATMADMPYDYRTYRDFPGEEAFRNGMRFRTLSTHYINTRSDSGIQELKNHLLEGNIAVLGVFGFSNLDNIRLFNNVYCVSQISGSRLYWHEVTVIGFDDNLMTADGVGAFRLVNEWGTGWGDQGFFWMSYEAVKSIRTSYGYAMYATDRIGYEPTLAARIQVQHTDRYNLIYRAGFGSTESPDTVQTFFDFNPMSLATGVPYPPSAIVIDLTDMAGLISSDNPNTIFLSVHDKRADNSHSGVMESLMIEDLTRKLCAISPDTPVPITDSGVDEVAKTILDYSLSPPQNLSAELDALNGEVLLSWISPIDVTGLNDYGIYQNGRLIDSTTSLNYQAELPDPGYHRYCVSARFSTGESLQSMATLFRPIPYGIPFSDGFETCLIGWIQAGISGIKAKIVDAPNYEGDHAVEMQTNESDYAAIARVFEPIEGAVFETWFNLESYPIPGQGFGAGAWLSNQQGDLLGAFINNNGNPGCLYPSSSQQPNIEILDSTVTVNLNQWYKHKIWYYNGKLHTMLLDENWNVLLNKITNFQDVQISQAGLIAWGLNGGWNYFDNYSIQECNGYQFEHFTPVNPTSQPYALIITDASLADDSLQAGDEIAVFDNDLCVGAVTVVGRWPIELNAWQKVGDNLGFIPENMMNFRVWSKQNNTEHYAAATFNVGNGTFSHGIFSRLSLIGGQIVSLQELNSSIPRDFFISPAYPNPFNSNTVLMLNLPQASDVEVTVYNIMGQKVVVLANDHFNAGRYRLTFDAKDLSNGIYFIQATIKGRMNEVKKVLLIK